DRPVPSQHVVGAVDRELAVDDNWPTVHDGVPGGGRAAAQPRLDRIAERARVRHALLGPTHQVAYRTDGELAEFACATETAGRPARRDLERVARRHRRRPST